MDVDFPVEDARLFDMVCCDLVSDDAPCTRRSISAACSHAADYRLLAAATHWNIIMEPGFEDGSLRASGTVNAAASIATDSR
jgi:hypothetical protein